MDLARGAVRWEVPLGMVPQLAGIPGAAGWGSPNFGGAATTAGGLVFIAAGVDPRLRAFDVETGRELWSAELPASAQATPMTYQLAPDRKQFVVIAAGGHTTLAYAAATVLLAWRSRRRPSDLLRTPVWVLQIVITVLCWLNT